MRTLLLSLLLAATLSTSADEGTIYIAASETEELIAKDGQKVVVHGRTKGSGKSGSGTNFVNFDGADFYLVTFKSDLKPFEEGEPADVYDGERIAVTGVLSIYQEKPQIKLTSPEQVRILAEDEEFPPAGSAMPADTKEDEKPSDTKAKEEEKSEEEPKKKPPVDASKYFK